MRGPLAVRIDDGSTDRHVTGQVSGLRWTKTAYGGDRDVSFTALVPRGTFHDLGAGDTVEVYDTRSGAVLFAAAADNPGATSGPGGDAYAVQAFGSAARLQSVRNPLGYMLRRDDVWERSGNSQKGAKTQPDERGDETPTLMIYANEGKNVTVAFRGEYVCRAFKRAGLEVGWLSVMQDAGVDDGNYRVRMLAGTNLGDLAVLRDRAASTTAAQEGVALDNILPTGRTIVALRLDRNTSSVTATDDHWVEFWDVVAAQTLLDLNGSRVLSGYNDGAVYAHEVVTDMLGRGMFPGVDVSRVSIASTSFGIDTLDWLDDGVTLGDALTQLLVFEPDIYWMASGSAFTLGKWDHVNPRYAISKRDGGITLPGQELTLCNRVLVTWTDQKGRDRSLRVVTTDAPVGAEGSNGIRLANLNAGLDFTRDAETISLPDGFGSESNAQRVGEKALELANDPPRAGTAVVRTHIFDHWRGHDVMPHELEPGCVVLEQETGHTYRLTQVDYSDADGAAQLTLGEPVRTTEQIVARLRRRRR